MYSFDFSRWPIVVVVHGASHTEPEFDDYLKKLEGLYARRERFVYVDSLPGMGSVPPLGRIKRFLAWFEQHREEASRWCIGSASVVPNAAMRGAANFFIQASRSDVPRYFARDLDDALDWAEQHLAMDQRKAATR